MPGTGPGGISIAGLAGLAIAGLAYGLGNG